MQDLKKLTPPIIASALAIFAGAFLLPRCSHNAPAGPPATSRPSPIPQAQAIASSSAAVTTTQRIVIRRSANPSIGKVGQTSKQSNGTSPTSQTSPAPGEPEDDGIILDITQTMTAGASSGAAASASAEHIPESRNMVPDHGRVGVILGTMPGGVALCFEGVRLDAPEWLIGAPLEIGVNVAANLEAVAAGTSVGGKVFAIVGPWARWDGRDRGVFVGAGMRF